MSDDTILPFKPVEEKKKETKKAKSINRKSISADDEEVGIHMDLGGYIVTKKDGTGFTNADVKRIEIAVVSLFIACDIDVAVPYNTTHIDMDKIEE